VTDEMLCPRCSAVNPRGTGFCGKCGSNLAATMATEAQPDPLIGAFIGERFLVKRKLGEGGMGVVYEAEQTAIDRKVALKVLHPHLTDESLYARFRNEAAAASRLGHPNTITVFDFGKTDAGSLYIAMEFIEGTSLDDEIKNNGAMDWRRAAHITTQICGSLHNAHEHGIVHRDLKPENVMLLTRSGEKDIVKVLDFGIAKIMEDDGKDQRQALTRTGMVFGTPQYMSPEQIRGEKVDARSDIYSLGVIVYQMLTGSLPFRSDTPMGLLTKHLMDVPPSFAAMNPAAKAPAEVESCVMQALAKNASERPQTMREMAERMEAFLRAAPAAAGPSFDGAAPKTVPMEAVSGRSAPASGAHIAAPKKKGGAGMIAGIAIGCVVLIGGGAAAWYFLLGPGSGGAPTQVAANVPPVTAPQNAVPPQLTAPATGPTAATDPSLAPLAAIPTETPESASGGKTTSSSGGSKSGGAGGGKIPSGTKPKGCLFNAGEDSIGQAVRDALRGKEAQIRACAQALAGEAATKFSFGVAANATQVSGVTPKSQTGLEGCIKPNLAVAIGSSDSKARTGDMTITMKGRGGMEMCNVQVNTQVKGGGGAIGGIGGKPGGGTTGGTTGGTAGGTGSTGKGKPVDLSKKAIGGLKRLGGKKDN
jgi:eukaryotic-like serine/threonine-protein kinase